jgi:hypothetical protein
MVNNFDAIRCLVKGANAACFLTMGVRPLFASVSELWTGIAVYPVAALSADRAKKCREIGHKRIARSRDQ